ncbi:MAG TPA: arginase [Gammaproteobacteria bacterium]|nr:arginase [Gammaproteobacteria bacterium]
MNLKNVDLIGYACGLAAGNPGCAEGPVQLQTVFDHLELLYPALTESPQDNYHLIAELSLRLAQRIEKTLQHKKQFIVFAGDHSCAIGTWSGVAHALREEKKDFGLIWIDAHLDSHTPETSPSGNIHGMPVASLLGHGNKLLTSILNNHPKIKPENICFIGIRSFERGEEDLIKKLNIKTYYMQEVDERGLDAVFKEAKARITKDTEYYGVSIDLDGIDPEDTPGVGTAEPNGIKADDLCKALREYCQHDPKLLGAEITEFNPHLDINHKTQAVIRRLVAAIY